SAPGEGAASGAPAGSGAEVQQERVITTPRATLPAATIMTRVLSLIPYRLTGNLRGGKHPSRAGQVDPEARPHGVQRLVPERVEARAEKGLRAAAHQPAQRNEAEVPVVILAGEECRIQQSRRKDHRRQWPPELGCV